MNTETSQLSAQFVNRAFFRKIDEGHIKEAQDMGSAFIRAKLRQVSFAREVLTPILLADDEIDRDENDDTPKKIVEKEPDSIATFVTFQGTGERTWFKGPRYSIKFGKVESQRFTKSKFELMTYQNDIRKILSDNSVKDIADVEDGKFIETCVAAIAGKPDQDINVGGTLQDAIVTGVKAHIGRKVPIGKLVMTKELYYDLLKLPHTLIGQIASRHYDDGVEQEEKLWGFPVVTTIKNNIVANDEIWIFSPQEFLGNFFLLQDATLFIKQEADIISFWTYDAPGIGIGNTKSITRVTLS